MFGEHFISLTKFIEKFIENMNVNALARLGWDNIKLSMRTNEAHWLICPDWESQINSGQYA